MTKAEMKRVVEAQVSMSALFIAHLLARTNRIQADLIDQLFNSSEKRLARTLLLLANFGKEGVTETLVPDISQETLAAMIGCTRSRVNYFLNRFRRLGFIEYDDRIRVNKSLLQVILHD
jgi:CRP-like cAMP-binding protein